MSYEDMNQSLAPHALLLAALYLSEIWYEYWRSEGSVYGKARAMVLFDRTLAGRLGDVPVLTEEQRQKAKEAKP